VGGGGQFSCHSGTARRAGPGIQRCAFGSWIPGSDLRSAPE
jgi:hypothetical protein